MNRDSRSKLAGKIKVAWSARFFLPSLIVAAILVTGGPVLGDDTNAPGADAQSGNLLRDYRSSIVLVNGTNGVAGTGFILSRAGRRFLVTNAHVMAAVKHPVFMPLDRSPLRFKPGPAVVAVGHDIIMMELQPGTNGIPRVDSFENTVVVNDPVAVYGNSGGGGVATVLEGKLVGVGPNRVEVDAPFEHGNSGSPIIDLPSGKVIGVATYVTTDDLISGEKKIRRFGYRLDSVRQWETVDWTQFYAEADKLAAVQATTAELKRAFEELNGLNERENKTRVYTYETDTIRAALDAFYAALHQAQTQQDETQAANTLLAALNDVSQSYPMSVKPAFTYQYFREQFDEDTTDRAEYLKDFTSILQK